MNRRPWTKREIEVLVWDTLEAVMLRDTAAKLNRTERACSLMRVELGVSNMTNCSRGWFQKGQTPHNKGLRRPGWAPGRMRETQFRKGERRGAANNNWKPIGTVLPDSEGFVRIKVRELNAEDKATGFGNRDVWQYVHRRVWEERNGPIPAGHTICFRDGKRSNCAIDNLELVSRAELMRRNTIHHMPPELKGTIMLLGAIKRKLRERNAKEHDDGPA